MVKIDAGNYEASNLPALNKIFGKVNPKCITTNVYNIIQLKISTR